MPYRILLCDDEIHILRAAEFKLKQAGYEVICASNGEEAWEEILRCEARRFDYRLPDAAAGRRRACASECGKIPATADLPILMLTAKGYELSHRMLSEQLGVLAILAKPFSPRALVRQVEEVCGRATSPNADGTANCQPIRQPTRI